MSVQDLALQRSKYKHLSDEEWRWFLQQVEGRERTSDKLPAFAQIEEWWYPVRLSCEQCSSEWTAKYKAKIVERLTGRMVDLTGGYGVDTLFLSEGFAHTDYVEQNAELCRIMAHNKEIKNEKLKIKNISVHNCTAEEFLRSRKSKVESRKTEDEQKYSLIFMDPARRDSHGGKVFKLADCTPNVVEMLPTLLAHLASEGRIMLKLSPMIDISQALKELGGIMWDIHVVAVKNEVKEVLMISTQGQSTQITAIDLAEPERAFVFTREEEQDAQPQMVQGTLPDSIWIYEPNAAILKAGAYKLAGARFGLQKLDGNTHLYVSEELMPDFPGRVWKVKERRELKQANVVVRNYPLTAEQLKKKLRLKDGGEDYIIGCRVNGKPTLFYAERAADDQQTTST